MMSWKVRVPATRPLHAGELALERAELQRVLDRHLQPLGRDRLDDEIDRAGAHGADHRVDAAMGGLDDDRDRAVELAELGEHRHAVEIGHHQIEDDERERVAVGRRQARERLLAAGDGGRAVAETLDGRREQPALDRIVVDDEDGGRHVLDDQVRCALRGPNPDDQGWSRSLDAR